MNQIRLSPDPLAAASAFVAGAALVALAPLQLTTSIEEASVEGAAEHAVIGLVVVVLAALIPPVLALGRAAGRPRVAAVPAIGFAALVALCAVTIVNGGDPSFFPLVAGPANLAMFAGLIAVAVVARRAGVLSRGMAIAVGLSYLGIVPLSQVGASALAGVVWLVVAAALLPRREVAVA